MQKSYAVFTLAGQLPSSLYLKAMVESRLVIDSRALNKVTHKFVWPMPNVEEIFSKLNGVQYYSTLDLQAGYNHTPLNDVSTPETVFTSPFRNYEYLEVPLGLAQAPTYFKELMNKVLKYLSFAIAYLDDIVIYSKLQKTIRTISNRFPTNSKMQRCP